MLAACLLVLSFPVPAATPILVVPAGVPRSIPLFGYDTDRATADAFADPAFRTAIRALRPAIVRYPGGAVAMYWDGSRGRRTSAVPIPGDRPLPAHRTPRFRPEEFARIVAATGAEPVWTLNVVTSSPGQEIAVLRRAKALGLSIRHVMLGDRIFDGPNRGSHAAIRYPSPIAYARAANAWATRLRAAFPEARVAIALSPYPLSRMSSRTGRWNAEVLPMAARVDAIAAPIHVTVGKASVGIADLPAALAEATYRAQTARWYLVDRLPCGAGGVWATEYARIETSRPGRTALGGTWAGALIAVSLAMHLVEDPRVTMLVGPPLAGNPAHSVLVRDGGRWRPTALGTALEMANAATAGMHEAQALAFAPNPVLHYAGDDSMAFALQGWVFRDAAGTRNEAVIVNRSGSWHALAVDSLVVRRRFRWERLSASPLVPGAIPRHERGTAAGTIVIRPWSITRLRWDVIR